MVKFDSMFWEQEFRYGMRLRGFSPGCQPMDGLVRAENSDKYWNVLVYNRPLTQKEIDDYELEEIT